MLVHGNGGGCQLDSGGDLSYEGHPQQGTFIWRSSLRQRFEDGVNLLGNSSQGKFKLVLEKKETQI